MFGLDFFNFHVQFEPFFYWNMLFQRNRFEPYLLIFGSDDLNPSWLEVWTNTVILFYGGILFCAEYTILDNIIINKCVVFLLSGLLWQKVATYLLTQRVEM